MHTIIFVLVLCAQFKNIFSTVALSKLVPPLPVPRCGENEVLGCWNECEVQCPSYNNLNAPISWNCTECMQGCICSPGFIRNSANGVCVGKDYCPIPDDPCLTREMFSVCGAGCQLTCIEPYPTNNCPRCVPGYVCIPGYVRNPITGLCVTLNECPPSLLHCIPYVINQGGGGHQVVSSGVHHVVSGGHQVSGGQHSQILINMLRKTPKKTEGEAK